jgi:Histidine kinase
VSGGSLPESSQTDQVRPLIAIFALVVAIVAVVTDPSSAADLPLAALPVGAFVVWSSVRGVPLPALSLAVVVPVVLAQREGQLEPLLFEASLLAFVVGRWASSREVAVALGLLVALSPVAASMIQDPSEIAVGIWILGVAFPWILGRAAARQRELTAQLDATRRELAQQALLAERRRIARDVHDFVGHGLATVMLQVTSARHVLHRDAAAAEEALRSAEEVGRRSMRELRRTVALLRRDDEAAAAPPLPSTDEMGCVCISSARASASRPTRRTSTFASSGEHAAPRRQSGRDRLTASSRSASGGRVSALDLVDLRRGLVAGGGNALSDEPHRDYAGRRAPRPGRPVGRAQHAHRHRRRGASEHVGDGR